jgi:glycogen(starch) synthase
MLEAAASGREPTLSVLMTTDAVGGVWRYSLDLCRELARGGACVTLVCLGPTPTEEQRSDARLVPGLTLREHPEPLEWMPDPWTGVDRSGRYLLALAAELQPDLVHLNGYSHGALDFAIPKVVVGHSCVLSWWHAVEATPPPAHLSTYRERVARGLRGAHAVIAPSRAMLESMKHHYGLESGNVIFNGSARPPTPQGNDEPPKEPIVLCAARLWDRAKNVTVLAEAARGCLWPVVVAGAGSAPSSVTALGHLAPEALAGWMQRASIYALPARYEPFGLSILEAAAAGAALVLGDIPSLRELWSDAAVYVAPDDASALRSALNRLAQDSGYRRALGERARRHAARYTLEQQASCYRSVYRELCTGVGGRHAMRPPARSLRRNLKECQ